MAPLTFRVLGPLVVLRDDARVTFSAPKQRALLSLLLLRRGEPISQEELIDDLWDGDAPPAARASFYNLVHALRRALGPETIRRTPGGYVLRTSVHATDLDRFRGLVAEARIGSAQERTAKLREALVLWRGQPFPDLAGSVATHPEIARLEEERLNAIEERMDAELELGVDTALVPELEELVGLHPLRERLWAQLMLALYRAGRQADALATYRKAHDAFADALGLEPGIVLRELQRAILVQDRALHDQKRALGSTLERAAAILPREPRERAESLYEYGAALIRVGELHEAAATLRAAGRLAESAGEPGLQERGRLLLSYLEVFSEGGRTLPEHLHAAERTAEVLEDLGDESGVALALTHQAHMHRDMGRAEHGLALAIRGAGRAARSGDVPGVETCLRMAATCAALGPTSVDEALEVCRKAEEAGSECDPLAVWDIRAWLLAQAGGIFEARELYERGLRAVRERGVLLNLMVGLVRAALAERAAGDLARAAEHLRTAHALIRAEDVRGELPAASGELACVLALMEKYGEAGQLAETVRSVPSRGDLISDVLWRRALALVAAHGGAHDEAVRLADEARAAVEGTDWLTFRGETLEDVATARGLAGDVLEEGEILELALDCHERKRNVSGADRVRRRLAGMRGSA